MERDKVIQLSQKGINDEREKQVIDKGYRYAQLSITIIVLFLLILRFINRIDITADLALIITAHICTLNIYQFIRLKSPIHIITFIITLIAFIASLILTLIQYGFIK